MLMPTSLPTIYGLVDPEANLAGAADGDAYAYPPPGASYDVESLGGPLFVAQDGTPIGVGNDCPSLVYHRSTALSGLREKEIWALALAGASAYLAWILFVGKRTPGEDKYRGASF